MSSDYSDLFFELKYELKRVGLDRSSPRIKQWLARIGANHLNFAPAPALESLIAKLKALPSSPLSDSDQEILERLKASPENWIRFSDDLIAWACEKGNGALAERLRQIQSRRYSALTEGWTDWQFAADHEWLRSWHHPEGRFSEALPPTPQSPPMPTASDPLKVPQTQISSAPQARAQSISEIVKRCKLRAQGVI